LLFLRPRRYRASPYPCRGRDPQQMADVRPPRDKAPQSLKAAGLQGSNCPRFSLKCYALKPKTGAGYRKIPPPSKPDPQNLETSGLFRDKREQAGPKFRVCFVSKRFAFLVRVFNLIPQGHIDEIRQPLDKMSRSAWSNAIDRTIPPCPYSVRRNFPMCAKTPPIVSNGGILL